MTTCCPPRRASSESFLYENARHRAWGALLVSGQALNLVQQPMADANGDVFVQALALILAHLCPIPKVYKTVRGIALPCIVVL